MSGSKSAEIVEFDNFTLIFDVYSEDLSLTDPLDITVTASLALLPAVSSTGSVQITIVNPCKDENLISIELADPEADEPNVYIYDGSDI